MPRPQRCRRVCNEPEHVYFAPPEGGQDCVQLSVDEFEVLRVVDYEKQTHEQCAQRMDISRSTVTEIYENARFKVARALVEGLPLVIGGGNYRVCGGQDRCAKKQCSSRCGCRRQAD